MARKPSTSYYGLKGFYQKLTPAERKEYRGITRMSNKNLFKAAQQKAATYQQQLAQTPVTFKGKPTNTTLGQQGFFNPNAAQSNAHLAGKKLPDFTKMSQGQLNKWRRDMIKNAVKGYDVNAVKDFKSTYIQKLKDINVDSKLVEKIRNMKPDEFYKKYISDNSVAIENLYFDRNITNQNEDEWVAGIESDIGAVFG